jgi:hypothetical protein
VEKTMLWIKGLALLLTVLVMLFLGLSAFGKARWATATQTLLAQLDAAQEKRPTTHYAESELTGLPPPVQRYFRAVLQNGQPIITAVNVTHTGSFNMGQDADQWRPFTSEQRVVTRRPGFVWNGHVMMLPRLLVHVHDAYVAGVGVLHPAVAGLISLTELRGTGDIAQGELLRFLGEAPWYPTALLPSQGVVWQAVDEHHARATLQDGPLSVTLLFTFNADGLIESGQAEQRGRTLGKTVVPTPWQGTHANYQTQAGMRVPMSGDVAWLTPAGRKPYWRGTITRLDYQLAP